jgi:cupin superfamily acireductone dioxygenase involved in methionine salvage
MDNDNGPEVLGPLGRNKFGIYAKCVAVDGDVIFSVQQPDGVVEITLSQVQMADLYSVTARAMHWSRIRRERRWWAERKKQLERAEQKRIEQQKKPQIVSARTITIE